MLNLSSLLEKFKHLKDPRLEKERLLFVINKCLGFDIELNDLDQKNEILYLNVSGYIKTEVFMRKEFILETLSKEVFANIKDIR